jgi:hypothetical protein
MTQLHDVSASSLPARIAGVSIGRRLSQLLVARPVAVFIYSMELYERALYPLYQYDGASFPGVFADLSALARRGRGGAAAVLLGRLRALRRLGRLLAGALSSLLPGLALVCLFDLDFPGMIYPARLSGFIVLTAVMAIAIALVPHLQWPFVLIGLLPSALFSRAGLGAPPPWLA